MRVRVSPPAPEFGHVADGRAHRHGTAPGGELGDLDVGAFEADRDGRDWLPPRPTTWRRSPPSRRRASRRARRRCCSILATLPLASSTRSPSAFRVRWSAALPIFDAALRREPNSPPSRSPAARSRLPRLRSSACSATTLARSWAAASWASSLATLASVLRRQLRPCRRRRRPARPGAHRAWKSSADSSGSEYSLSSLLTCSSIEPVRTRWSMMPRSTCFQVLASPIGASVSR